MVQQSQAAAELLFSDHLAWIVLEHPHRHREALLAGPATVGVLPCSFQVSHGLEMLCGSFPLGHLNQECPDSAKPQYHSITPLPPPSRPIWSLGLTGESASRSQMKTNRIFFGLACVSGLAFLYPRNAVQILVS